MFKLLCGVALLCGLALAAPRELNEKAAKKRVERNKRGLLHGDVVDSKLDLENYLPLDVLEKSLELTDGKGDNEVNGTKKINDKDIQYYHKKNQGTVKTIVEEKARDDNKLENVFYHLSYEKQDDAESTPATLLETDQTLADETTLDDDEEETTLTDNEDTTPPADNEETRNTVGSNDDEKDVITEKVQIINKISDPFNGDPEPLNDATVPSEETPDSDEQTQPDQPQAGWFNNWFGQGEKSSEDTGYVQTTQSPALGDTPDLDRAIYSQQLTILSPFCFGSIGLKSPSCPAHRSTLVSIYFFSFCV